MLSNGRVADALAKDGHNVTLLEVEYDLPPDVIVTAHHARRLHIRGPFVKVESEDEKFGWLVQNSFSESSFWYRLFFVYNFVTEFRRYLNGGCEAFIQRRDVIEMLKAEKYDVMISEQLSLCGTGYAKLLGIKTHVWLSSCAIVEYMSSSLGLPPQPSWVPAVVDAEYSDKMTYTERVGNLMFTLANTYTFQRGVREETEVFRRHFGKDFPALDDLAKDSPLTIVSVDEFVEFPRPLTHNIVYIGGLELANHSAKSLKEPFASEMEKGKRGVVFVSFGSSTPTRYFPEVVRRNMLKAISELPDYHFIMKVDKEDENR
ncbi:UGT-49 protein [Aphelenchoides avenae]|nr:UGT-49 protein [Aphelenchus avenae]